METGVQNAGNQENSLPKILIVDDEPRVLRSLEAALKYKFDVVVAQDAIQARGILEESEQFNVVVSDERMPKCPGHVFLKWVKDNHPHSVRILLTSTDISSLKESIISADVYQCLSKPWNVKEFEEILEQAVLESQSLASLAPKERRSSAASQHCAMAVLDLGATYLDTYQFLGEEINGIVGMYFFDSHEEVITAMEQHLGIGVLLVDLSIGISKAANLISEMNAKHPYVSIIVTDDPTHIENFTQSFEKSLVFKYITKPMSSKRLQPLISRALERYFVDQAKYRIKMGLRKFDRRKSAL